MNIVKIIIEISIPVLLFIFLFKYYISSRESKLYTIIDFINKGEYLCIFYLQGSSDLKSNIGVVSKTTNGYLIETEDDGKIDTCFINYDNVSLVNIKPVDSKVGYNVLDPLKKQKKKTIRKGYEIKIITKDDKRYLLLSKKNPKNFFNK